ncbi:MAG: von Willebrand factor type A domain-containing protein [Pseudomonadota bacterium]
MRHETKFAGLVAFAALAACQAAIPGSSNLVDGDGDAANLVDYDDPVKRPKLRVADDGEACPAPRFEREEIRGLAPPPPARLAAPPAQSEVPPPPPAPPPPPPPPPPQPGSSGSLGDVVGRIQQDSSQMAPANRQRVTVTGSRVAKDDFVSNSPIETVVAETFPDDLRYARPAGDIDRERYPNAEPNPVKLSSEEPVSTFSIDVDTAAYANARRMLSYGQMPPSDAVRIEELINYFDYRYDAPGADDEHPFSTFVSVAPSPWADGRDLMHIAIQGRDISQDERPPINLTLLMDVSGSMRSPDKLPLAKTALTKIIPQLRREDTVSIVVYAGAAGAVLEPTSGFEPKKIRCALENLRAGGSTAGGAGLQLAYELAEKTYRPDGVNRVMILTDGDFNVGVVEDGKLEDFVARKRKTGIYLSVMGFGQGNYNDALMQTLSQAGNGIAGYVDNEAEAEKLFNDDLAGNMFPIADDVKIQIEFNPAEIAEYRLIGYETRLLNREDFNNDAVDAGDIGAGSNVTALYEITRVGSDARLIDTSRYQSVTNQRAGVEGELAFLKLRYKAPGADESVLITRPVTEEDAVGTFQNASEATRFAAAVAGFGQALRGDPYLSADFNWDTIKGIAENALGEDPYGYRAGFVKLVDTTAEIDANGME